MLSGGKDSFDTCKGISGRDAEYCRWLARQCDEHKKTQVEDKAGAQADQYVLITCSGEELTFPSYDVCVGAAQLFAPRSNKCPKVWGLIPINYENAVEKVGKGKAMVIVANPDDPQLGDQVSGLRKDYGDHKFFLIDNADLGAYATLAMLKVNKELAGAAIRDGFIEPLLFADGSCRGVAQPALVPPKPLSEADKDERAAHPTVPPKPEPKAKPPDKWTMGFHEVKNLGRDLQVARSVLRMWPVYPSMVVIGRENCPACLAFKADLLEAQRSGKWDYHRLIYIDITDKEFAFSVLKQLNLLKYVESFGLIPQAYVFKARRHESGWPMPEIPKGDMSEYMKSLRKHIWTIAQKARKLEKQRKAGEAQKARGLGARHKALKKTEKVKEASEAEEKKVVIERKKIVIIERKDKAKKPIEGPTGFMELSWQTIGDVKDAIKKGKYPVMVVVGSEHPASRQLRSSLFKLQQSGRWEYHRLVFINFHVEKARRLLKELGLSYRRVKKLDLLPQIYIFKGELQPEVVRGGFSAGYMQALRRRYIGMARKIKGAKEVAKGPLGHLPLTPGNFNKVKSDILTSAYPFMVVVGNAVSPTDKFWKGLRELQQSDKWEYHRLIFINFYTEVAKDLMQKLGIYDHVKKVGFFPQMYVFRGRLSPEEPEGGFTKDQMRSLRRRLVKIAEENESGGAKKID